MLLGTHVALLSASEQAESLLKVHLKSLYLTDEITTGNPRLLSSITLVMQAKEYAGQERAWGAIGFAEIHFDARLCEKLAALQQAQEHQFNIFCEFSCKPHKAALEALNQSPAAIDITQLRNMIAQLGDGSPIAAEISEVWFDVATRRIDAMQIIEVALTEALIQQASSKVTDAKNEMANHQQLLTRFNDEHATDGSPLTLLFDARLSGKYNHSRYFR